MSDQLASALADDPNAATRNQMMVKRAERAIRRYCEVDLLLALDAICLLDNEEQMKREMVKLSKTLEQKTSEAGKGSHAEGTD